MSSLTLGGGGIGGNAPFGYRLVVDSWEHKPNQILTAGATTTVTLASDKTKNDKAVLILPVTAQTSNGSAPVLMKDSSAINSLGWSNNQGDIASISCVDFIVGGVRQPLYADDAFDNASAKRADVDNAGTSAPTIGNLVYGTNGWIEDGFKTYLDTQSYDRPALLNIVFKYGGNTFFANPVYMICLPFVGSASISFKNVSSSTLNMDTLFWGIGHLETIDDFYNS